MTLPQLNVDYIRFILVFSRNFDRRLDCAVCIRSYIFALNTVGRKNVTRGIFSWRRLDRTGLLAAELPLAHVRVCGRRAVTSPLPRLRAATLRDLALDNATHVCTSTLHPHTALPPSRLVYRYTTNVQLSNNSLLSSLLQSELIVVCFYY